MWRIRRSNRATLPPPSRSCCTTAAVSSAAGGSIAGGSGSAMRRIPCREPDKVRLIEPGGRELSGAAAVLAAMRMVRERYGCGTLRTRPAICAIADAAYAFVARHRDGFAKLDRFLYGNDQRSGAGTHFLTRARSSSACSASRTSPRLRQSPCRSTAWSAAAASPGGTVPRGGATSDMGARRTNCCQRWRGSTPPTAFSTCSRGAACASRHC